MQMGLGCRFLHIANRLAFSSQSHFIQQFKESVGMTPKKYRDKYYMVEWNIESEPDAPTQDGCGKPPAGPDKP